MEDFFDEIYFSMLGQMRSGHELLWAGDAFYPGSVCDEAYHRVRQAYGRLCDRLGVQDEDEDLECIIREYERIQADLCRRMFACGAAYALMERNEDD